MNKGINVILIVFQADYVKNFLPLTCTRIVLRSRRSPLLNQPQVMRSGLLTIGVFSPVKVLQTQLCRFPIKRKTKYMDVVTVYTNPDAPARSIRKGEGHLLLSFLCDPKGSRNSWSE